MSAHRARLLSVVLATILFCGAGGWAHAQSKDAPQDAAKQPGKGGPPGAGGPAGGKPPGGMPVKAVAVKVGPAVHEASAVGTLRADESISIRPEVAGRIDKLRFGEGQAVKKGDLLVALDAAENRAQLASSRAQAQLDAQRLERAEDLFGKRFISQQALDEARSNHARSAAKQREDEARLARTEIRAPFAGVAGLRQVSEGAYLAVGTEIAKLEKLDQMKLDFRIPETQLARLKAGQKVKVAVDAYPAAEFTGAVYAIEPSVDEQTRTVQVRARVVNAGLKLRPGMFARVQISLGTREKALWVPEEAIVPRGRDSFVYRVIEGKVELVRVEVGARKVGEVEIEKGLAAGELVVTEGTQKIGPGAPVTVLPAGAPPARPPATAAAAEKKG